MAETPNATPEGAKAPDAPAAIDAKNDAREEPKEAAPAAARPAKPAGGKGQPWGTRAEAGIRDFAEAVAILSQGLISPDAPTRRMAAMFFASCALLLAVVLFGGYWLRQQVRLDGTGVQARSIEAFLQKQIESADAAAASTELGAFTIDLRNEHDGRNVPGVVNLAEIAMTVQCDGREACEYLRANLERARDQVTHVFVYTDRAELMSSEGKKRIKASIVKRLNHILPKGKVVEIWFTKLLIS